MVVNTHTAGTEASAPAAPTERRVLPAHELISLTDLDVLCTHTLVDAKLHIDVRIICVHVQEACLADKLWASRVREQLQHTCGKQLQGEDDHGRVAVHCCKPPHAAAGVCHCAGKHKRAAKEE